VSFNRYCFMLVLLAFSLLFTLGPFVWYVVGENMSPSTRPTGPLRTP